MWHAITTIDGKFPVRPGTMDGLAYMRGIISGIGFDGLKLELSPAYATKYPYDTWGTLTSMRDMVQAAPMAATLADPAFVRYQFSAFSIAYAFNNPWSGLWNDALGDQLEGEFYDLCAHLRATYPNKHFIMSNWEGDWQLLNSFNPNAGIPLTRLNAYRDWQRRRWRALNKAVADNPGGTGTMYHAIECNRVLDDWSFRLHRDVLSNVPHHRVGGSIYECIEGWQTITNQAAFEADIEAKINRWVARVREYSAAPIIIGEYGWPRYASYFPSGLDVPALFAKVIAVANSLGVEGEIPWQATGNEESSPGVDLGFSFWDRNGSSATVGALNDVGIYFRDNVL